MPAHRIRTPRPRTVLGLPASIAGLVTAAVILGAPGPSAATDQPTSAPAAMPAAAPSRVAEAAAPTTVTKGKLSVTVDPAGDIGTSGSALTVTGTGYKPGKDDLWIAVCQDGGGAPKDLTRCLGGPIPDGNTTTSWGIVTQNADQAPPGPVVVPWGDDGFTVKLQVAGGADQAADCIAGKCSVVVRDAQKSGGNDMAVPIAFKAPTSASASSASSSLTTSSSASAPSSASGSTSTSTSTSVSSTASSSTTSSPPSTASTSSATTSAASSASSSSASSASSTIPVPTTVPAQSVLLKQVRQGDEEVVVFTGFQPGEPASVSIVASPPVALPQATADAGGRFRISWRVPEDFPVRRYSMRLEGLQSRRVGLADFSVVARQLTASSASAASTAQSPASSAGAPASSAAGLVITTTAAASTAPSSAAPTSAAPGTATTGRSSTTPWWLWIILAAIILLALVLGAVDLGRRHRRTAEADLIARENELSDAAAVQIVRAPPPVPPMAQAPIPPEYDEDPDRPILFSHRQAENYSPPTELIGDPDAPTAAIGTPSGPPRQGDPTGAWKPDFTTEGQRPPDDDPVGDPGGGAAAGPGTQQFNPFADDRTDESSPADQSGPSGSSCARDDRTRGT